MVVSLAMQALTMALSIWFRQMTMDILTLDEIRAAESLAFQKQAPYTLMHCAGNAAASWIRERFPVPGPVLVLAGPGNNGGDGWVVARELLHCGYTPIVVFTGDPQRLPGDAARARREYLEAGGPVAADWQVLPTPLLVVDAIFGIGLNRPPEGRHAEWIARTAALHCPVVALDIPSGLHGDSGRAQGPTIRASHTLTFIAAKAGLYTADGPDHCGAITVLDLGVPAPGSGALLDGPAILRARPARARNTHKGQFGAVGILGGAQGTAGAALLAAVAALKCGAGRVWLAPLDEALSAALIALHHPELMVHGPQALLHEARLTTLVVGPGLGQSTEAAQLLAAALSLPIKLVLDADALNLVAAHPDLAVRMVQRTAPTLLTPHPAEACRLMGEAALTNRVRTALALARRYQALVVLKGCGSIIATPQGQWWINSSGNAGLSAPGMGDVLAGALGALMDQGLSPLQALQCAVHAHGAAADHCLDRGLGPLGLTASEVIDALREVLNAR